MKVFLLTILGLLGVLLCLFVVLMLVGRVNLRVDSTPDPRVVQSLQSAAAAGVPIVQAIYDYRSRTGLFPEKLNDLARYSGVEVDPGKWSYEWCNWQWSLHYTGKELQAVDATPPALSYHWDHMDRGTGWNVSGSRKYMNTQITAAIAIPNLPPRTARQSYETFVAELKQRIDRDPRNPIHQQGLISRRISEGDLEAALSDAIRMHEQHLLPRWELQVLSHILHRLNRDNWALRELSQAAEASPSFIQYFNLAESCKDADQHTDALRALEQACNCPFGSKAHSTQYVDEYYLCIAAAYAYRQKQYPLAVRICNYWQRHCQAKGYGERSYHAIRGASNLALGNLDVAASDINLAVAANKEGATWAGNLDQLEAALKARQKAFSWDPGPCTQTDVSDLLIAYH